MDSEFVEGELVYYISQSDNSKVYGYVIKEFPPTFPQPSWANWDKDKVWAYWEQQKTTSGRHHIGWVGVNRIYRAEQTAKP